MLSSPPQLDGNDGYISDVPSQYSNGPSEVSKDLIASAKVLERHFKDKYKVLRVAYEDRIRQLSRIVSDTCASLMSDEILGEMKNDKTSSVFIPAHLSEIINHHLESERERYLHQMVEKLGSIEVEHAKLLSTSSALNRKVLQLEREVEKHKESESSMKTLLENYQNMEHMTKEKAAQMQLEVTSLRAVNEQSKLNELKLSKFVEELQSRLANKEREFNELKAVNDEKCKEYSALEQSFEQSTREFAIIETLDKQEQILKKELKEQVFHVNQMKEKLAEEYQELLYKHTMLIQEYEVLEQEQNKKIAQEQFNKECIAKLMHEVEEMVSQEARENSTAIAMIHEKMKLFRVKMTGELQREKRLTAAQQEEIQRYKAINDELQKENHKYIEEEEVLRTRLHSEQEHVSKLRTLQQELTAELTSVKLKFRENELKCIQLQEKLNTYNIAKAEEMQALEERVKMQAEREMQKELLHLDQKSRLHQMHYQNELGYIHNHLRHSYTFGTHPSEFPLQQQQLLQGQQGVKETSFLNMQQQHARQSFSQDDSMASSPLGVMAPPPPPIPSLVDPMAEISFRQTISHYVEEVKRLKETHKRQLTEVEVQLKTDHQRELSGLQQKLIEATQNIDKLRHMVSKDRSVIASQNELIEQLHELNTNLQHAQTSLAMEETVLTSSSPQKQQTGNKSPVGFISGANRLMERSNQVKRLASPVKLKGIAKAAAASAITKQQQQLPDASISQFNAIFLQSKEDLKSAKTRIIELENELVKVKQHYLEGEKPSKDGDELRVALARNRELQERIEFVQSQLDEQSLLHQQQLQRVRYSHADKVDEDVQRKYLDSLAENRQLQEHIRKLEKDLEMQLIQFHKQTEQLTKLQSSAMKHATPQKHHEPAAAKSTLNKGGRKVTQDHDQMTDLGMSEIGRISYNQVSTFVDTMEHSTMTEDNSTLALPSTRGARGVFDNDQLITSIQANQHNMLVEDTIQHQLQLTELSLKELSDERERRMATRQQEIKLYSLLVTVERTYRGAVFDLRKELATVRNLISNIPSLVTMEIRNTVQNLHIHLNRIFNKLNEKQQKELKSLRVELGSIHMKELNTLEAQFIKQITEANKAHAVELENMHRDLVSKAEHALSIGIIDNNLKDTSMLRSYSRGAFSKPTTPGSVVSGMESVKNPFAGASTAMLMAPTSLQQTLPAYESVLNGVLEALLSYEMLAEQTLQQIQSLAQVHTEPSFAATSTAKSLISSDIEKYLLQVRTQSRKLSTLEKELSQEDVMTMSTLQKVASANTFDLTKIDEFLKSTELEFPADMFGLR